MVETFDLDISDSVSEKISAWEGRQLGTEKQQQGGEIDFYSEEGD